MIRRLTDLHGLQPFSGNVVDDEVFFSTERQIHRLSLADGRDQIIANQPGADFGEVTVSSDRRWAAALITRRGASGIFITRTDGSQSDVILEGVRALYHPQFHPADPDRLIYSADLPDPACGPCAATDGRIAAFFGFDRHSLASRPCKLSLDEGGSPCCVGPGTPVRTSSAADCLHTPARYRFVSDRSCDGSASLCAIPARQSGFNGAS